MQQGYKLHKAAREMTNCGRPEPLHDNGTWPALAVQTKRERGEEVAWGGQRTEKNTII